ncbi:luciferin 4-monooxygenase-like [Anticarsia gemmatalis]|uniref:luciferin 4-monooxygenase-like n=1 Tax=Anticarsia gemmatalis TaxID=129554 RepID=UPI003F77333F
MCIQFLYRCCTNKVVQPYCINERVRTLRRNAAARWKIKERDCHVGHLVLQAMLQEPDLINQIDGATGEQETNLSVATRTAKLASAMVKYGLKPGDSVLLLGKSHLDICIPYFACHVGGYAMCSVDTSGAGDLHKIWPYVQPKMIFCQKSDESIIRETIATNGEKCELVIFDDKENDLEAFIKKHGGTDVNYRPAVFDQSKITAWLMLTSGTTGLPKVAIIPFDTLLNGLICWWTPFPKKINITMVVATLQWMSALIFYISGPLKVYTRLQSSAPPSPQALIGAINKYKPCATSFTPYLLGRFLVAAENVCDLSCFKFIIIGGSAIEKPLLDRFRTKCSAQITVVYGMTELLVPVFEYNDQTPFGASGKPFHDRYDYRIVDDNGQIVDKPNQTGELWIKGNDFFKGYRNNPEETKLLLTDDGWVMTGDIFYRDDQDYYFFVERKKLVIKQYTSLIFPLEVEEVLKRHPKVSEVCVVNLPDPECIELAVAAVQLAENEKVEAKELYEIIDQNILLGRQLKIAFFFVESFPVTPSGKLHRAKVKEIAAATKSEVFKRTV